MAENDPLRDIFAADRALRAAEAALFERRAPEELAEELAQAVEEARGLSDRDESILRLERLADLCAQVPGPQMVDALIRILDDEEPSVRVAAGEALVDIGYERYAEVARGIERALAREKTGRAMEELPLVVAEIGEPSALALIRPFLVSESPDVIASAIEAIARLGDPGAIGDLERFTSDERIVVLDEFEEETSATLGELAAETIAELSGDHEA